MTDHTFFEDIPGRETVFTIRKPSDWLVLPDTRYVRHGPSRTIFEVTRCPGMQDDERVRVELLRAELVHGCEGQAPARAELALLGYEAAIVMAEYIGIISLIEEGPDVVPS